MTVDMDDFSGFDLIAQAGLVRVKEATAEELPEAAIARAEKVNPRLNAIIAPLHEQARAEARSPVKDSRLIARFASAFLGTSGCLPEHGRLRGRHRSPHYGASWVSHAPSKLAVQRS